MKMKYVMPLFGFAALALALAAILLSKDELSQDLEFPLMGEQMPAFSLPLLRGDGNLSPDLWRGDVAVISIFASWCQPCAIEHPRLERIAKVAPIYGIAWRDKSQAVTSFLQGHGDFFKAVGLDEKGESTVTLALTGIPELFIVNRHGVIVYHHRSPVTDAEIDDTILPLIDTLNHAP